MARTPEEVVEELGRRMQRVPTTASAEIAAKAIRDTYASLVEPRLLKLWAASPGDAPGRPVSSPWPERIIVQSSSHTGNRATVHGVVVEATSTGEARRVSIEVQLERSDGSWLITAYGLQAEQASEDGAQAAVAVVREYYRAISARDFERAYSYWGASGPPGQSLRSFAAGFADTASVEVTTGVPSRIEAAAGSRYIEVPVTIEATTRGGEKQRFEGMYTLRRTVVDGATASQRKWHFDRASIHPIAKAVNR